MNLSVSFAGITLSNPTMLASGVLGVSKACLSLAVKHGAGGCVIKSISPEPRPGHPAPNMHPLEGGFINAVGYSNPGIEAAKLEFHDLKDIPAPVFASIIGKSPEEFSFMAENFLAGTDFTAVEVPLSCPHTPGFGTMAGQSTPEATETITKAIRAKTKLPLFIKLSPMAPQLADVGRAAQAGGADGITVVNTMGPGMYINIEMRSSVIHFGMGGISGPALRPIAVRCVADLYKAVSIPIIGCGGVQTGRDAIEMMMAGANAVQIGTGIYYRGIEIFEYVQDEMKLFMEEQGIQDIKEIIGCIHK